MQTITTIGLDIAKTDQACDVKILLANLEPSTHGLRRQDQIDEVLSAFGQFRNYARSWLRTDLSRLTRSGHCGRHERGPRHTNSV